MSLEVQRTTFYLLWCERCGHCAEAPRRFESPDFALCTEPLRCNDCFEFLTLIEAFVADETRMWQKAPGSMWHHVIYPDSLPDRPSRQLWTKR